MHSDVDTRGRGAAGDNACLLFKKRLNALLHWGAGKWVPAPGVGDTPSPQAQRWVWGQGTVRASSPCTLLGPPWRPPKCGCFPGKRGAESSAWKGLGGSVKVTFAGDRRCLLRDVGRFGAG